MRRRAAVVLVLALCLLPACGPGDRPEPSAGSLPPVSSIDPDLVRFFPFLGPDKIKVFTETRRGERVFFRAQSFPKEIADGWQLKVTTAAAFESALHTEDIYEFDSVSRRLLLVLTKFHPSGRKLRHDPPVEILRFPLREGRRWKATYAGLEGPRETTREFIGYRTIRSAGEMREAAVIREEEAGETRYIFYANGIGYAGVAAPGGRSEFRFLYALSHLDDGGPGSAGRLTPPGNAERQE